MTGVARICQRRGKSAPLERLEPGRWTRAARSSVRLGSGRCFLVGVRQPFSDGPQDFEVVRVGDDDDETFPDRMDHLLRAVDDAGDGDTLNDGPAWHPFLNHVSEPCVDVIEESLEGREKLWLKEDAAMDSPEPAHSVDALRSGQVAGCPSVGDRAGRLARARRPRDAVHAVRRHGV